MADEKYALFKGLTILMRGQSKEELLKSVESDNEINELVNNNKGKEVFIAKREISNDPGTTNWLIERRV